MNVLNPGDVKGGPVKHGPEQRLAAKPQHGFTRVPVSPCRPRVVTQAADSTDSNKLLEEAKRARRRYRRRLARCAAQKWLQFASQGLAAIRFSRTRLQRTALVSWQSFVQSRRKQWRQAVQAVTRRHLALQKRAWQSWQAYLVVALRHHGAVEHLLWAAALGLYRRSFTALQAYTRTKSINRQNNTRALLHWKDTILHRYFYIWNKYSQSRNTLRSLNRTALWHWAEHHQRKAFETWKGYLAQKVALQEAREMCLEARARILKGGCFQRWLSAVESRKEKECKLDQACAFLYMGLSGRAFRGWVEIVKEKERKAGRVARAESVARERLKIRRLSRGWVAWNAYVKSRRDKAESRASAERLRNKNLIRRSLRAWKAVMSRRLRKAEAPQVAARLLLRKAFKAFLINLHHHDLKHRKLLICSRFWERCTLRKVWLSWRQVAEAHRLERLASEEMLEEQRTKSALAWRQGFWLARVVSAWRTYAEHKGQREVQRRRAVRFHYRSTLRKGLQAFRCHVSNRRLKAQESALADVTYQRNLVQRILAVHWHREAMETRRTKRQVLGKAYSQWRQSVLRRSLRAWRTASARLAVKSGKKRKAQEHWAASTAHKWFLCWRLWTISHLQKSAEKRGRLSKLSSALGKQKQKRVLAAWCEWTTKRAVKKLQSARSREHFRERKLKDSLIAWTKWTQKQRAKKAKLERAEKLAASCLLRQSLSAWHLYHLLCLSKRRTRSRAVLHWCLHLERARLRAWQAWVQNRKRKRRQVARAEQVFRDRLQQRAARQWLEVGLRRQQWRTQIALERQAATQVQELLRIAPFAHKWRSLARERAAQRHLSHPPQDPSSAPPRPPLTTPATKREPKPTLGIGLSSTKPVLGARQPRKDPLDRITASIAAGASTLESLRLRAALQSRPPPRRPAFLLAASAKSSHRLEMKADRLLEQGNEKGEKASEGVDLISVVQEEGLRKTTSSSEFGSIVGARPGKVMGSSPAQDAATAREPDQGSVQKGASSSPAQGRGRSRPVKEYQKASGFEREVPDPASVAAEMAWMEKVLCEYAALQAEVALCGAQLVALQREEGGAEARSKAIREKLAALEENKRVQLPLVKAVAARIQSMRAS